MLTKRLEILENELKESKTQKEMLNDALANDGELLELEEKVKDARRRYNAQKEALLNEPENRKVLEKYQDVTQSIKELRKLLSDELIGFVMQNNTLEVEDVRGNKYHVTISAKIKSTNQLSLL